MTRRPRPTIIGFGSRWRGDDAVGPRVVDGLRALGIDAIEMAGDGLALVERLRETDAVVIVDAMRSGAPPGTIETFDALGGNAFLRPVHRQLLGWAADLHETGLSVAHSQYQRHSGYLVEYSDMTGFTRQEQLFLASLVRYHRRPIPSDYTDLLPTRLHEPLRMTLFCLRFACILCRSRDSQALPDFRLSGSDNRISVVFAADWAEQHPLTLFDLQQESKALAPIGIGFRVSLSPA